MTIQYGYADSTVVCDVEKTCVACRTNFWFTAGEQDFYAARGLVPPKRCKPCRDARRNAVPQTQPAPALSTALVVSQAPVSAAGSQAGALPALPKVFTDKAALFGDIKQLLEDAISPIEHRRRTFWEWLRGIDPVAEQVARKQWATQTADQLVQQRTALFNHIQEMIMAATKAEIARIEAQVKLRQAQLYNLQLEEAIERQQALREHRVHTGRLQEAVRHKELQEVLVPPVEEKADPTKMVIAEVRSRARSRAAAKQAVISDCLNELRRLHRSKLETSEKAARMRIVMETYGVELEALPKSMRTFLERVEDSDE